MAAPHPYSATVLGIPLRSLASDAERELILSLAEQPQTAAIWPVYQVAGATDHQIDTALRAPGQRCSLTTTYSQRRSHHWYWRATHETGFYYNGSLALSGPTLFATLRRLLGIAAPGLPVLEPVLEPPGLVNGRAIRIPISLAVVAAVAAVVAPPSEVSVVRGQLSVATGRRRRRGKPRRRARRLCRDHQVVGGAYAAPESDAEMAERLRDEMAELASRAEMLDGGLGDEDEDDEVDERESVRERLDWLLEEWISHNLHRPGAGAPMEARG